MVYKTIDQNFSFADIVVQKYADKNHFLLFLREVKNTIEWDDIEEFLIKSYEIGKAKKGTRAYSPLLLFKCLLLKKWFQIKSDFALEHQINDRISFKIFLDLPMDCPSPAQSTFVRFRKRISTQVIDKVEKKFVLQFQKHGFSINKGFMREARIAKPKS